MKVAKCSLFVICLPLYIMYCVEDTEFLSHLGIKPEIVYCDNQLKQNRQIDRLF